jgi:hypothetical protein
MVYNQSGSTVDSEQRSGPEFADRGQNKFFISNMQRQQG